MRPAHVRTLAALCETVPCTMQDSARDDVIADSCAFASSRYASATFRSRSSAVASAGLSLNSSTIRAMLAQQMPTFSARSFF